MDRIVGLETNGVALIVHHAETGNAEHAGWCGLVKSSLWHWNPEDNDVYG